MCGPSTSRRPTAKQQESWKGAQRAAGPTCHFAARRTEAPGGEGLTQFTPGANRKRPLVSSAPVALPCLPAQCQRGTKNIRGKLQPLCICSSGQHPAPASLWLRLAEPEGARPRADRCSPAGPRALQSQCPSPLGAQSHATKELTQSISTPSEPLTPTSLSSGSNTVKQQKQFLQNLGKYQNYRFRNP